MDITLGFIFLILALPVFLLAAIAVKAETPGPIFFRQRRYGKNGQIFEIIKFRTMHAELADADALVQTQIDDQRVTGVGAVLRRHSLDEIPQVINVIRGEMSLVGPRPHALGTSIRGVPLIDLIKNYESRHQVRPGLTGLAQVNGCRGALDTEEKAFRRLQYDLNYIANRSIWLDCKVLIATIRCIFDDDHAY